MTGLMKNAEIDDLLSSWMRDEWAVESPVRLEASSAAILTRIEFHGIIGLLNTAYQNKITLPEKLAIDLHERAVGLAFWEASHVRLLKRILPALAAHGITPLLLKGTALAYSHYADPASRSRGDTDILVACKDYDRAGGILRDCGVSTALTPSGRLITLQRTFKFKDLMGIEHDVDLHERLNDSTFLSRLFTYEELLGRAKAVPRLSGEAISISPVDALLLACMHRFKHLQSPYFVNGITYYSADRLIWLQDIHLLARSFSAEDWTEILKLARLKGLGQICYESLLATQSRLKTTLPEGIIEQLQIGNAQNDLKRYMAASKLSRVRMDLNATQGITRKAQFLREAFFPPAAHMYEKYNVSSVPTRLPWLYTRRIIGAFWKQWHRNGRNT